MKRITQFIIVLSIIVALIIAMLSYIIYKRYTTNQTLPQPDLPSNNDDKNNRNPPSQPTNQPTNQPNQPNQPTQPTSQPTQPTNQPTNPTSQPTQPTQPTSQPTSQPTQPTQPTSQPTSQPTQPTNQPTQPTSQPVQPSQSSQPGGKCDSKLKDQCGTLECDFLPGEQSYCSPGPSNDCLELKGHYHCNDGTIGDKCFPCGKKNAFWDTAKNKYIYFLDKIPTKATSTVLFNSTDFSTTRTGFSEPFNSVCKDKYVWVNGKNKSIICASEFDNSRFTPITSDYSTFYNNNLVGNWKKKSKSPEAICPSGNYIYQKGNKLYCENISL
jgi:hypothetical protein